MQPERIQGESRNAIGDYTVAADVWSLGLTAIEIASGTYPYPPHTYGNVFAQVRSFPCFVKIVLTAMQLQCILSGDLPTLPTGYSQSANHWVVSCLDRNPDRRPVYSQLLQHPFLAEDEVSDVDMVAWVNNAMKFKGSKRTKAPPSEDVGLAEPA